MTALAAAAIVDVTLILFAALLAMAVLRRRSAALRHRVLAMALAACAAAPLLELVLPQHGVALPWLTPRGAMTSGVQISSGLPAVGAAAETVAGTAASPSVLTRWPLLLALGWGAGVLWGLADLAAALVRLRRAASRCSLLAGGPWYHDLTALLADAGISSPRLLESRDPSLVLTWGWRHPRILVPADGTHWPASRRRRVLAHEMAHIARGDWPVQIGAAAVRALFWFHPLAWMAVRRLRLESERACDDAVLRLDAEPAGYAEDLLEIARLSAAPRVLSRAAAAIAHPSTLERRIAAMLMPHIDRAPLSPRGSLLAALAVALMALPVVTLGVAAADPGPLFERPIAAPAAAPSPVAAPAVEPEVDASPAPRPEPAPAAAPAAAQQPPSSIRGTLFDPLGGFLPGATVQLTDLGVGAVYSTVTGRDGSFAFIELQPARYELIATLPGFAPVRSVMPIGAGTAIERQIVMPLGSLQETITVVCAEAPPIGASAPPRVLPPRSTPAPAAQMVPFAGGMGGQIQVPRQLAKENPICPRAAVTSDTVVMLGGRVGIDGYLSDLKELRADNDLPAASTLIDAALDAVRLWHYSPTRLNGVPVEAGITITVLFKAA